MNVRPGVLPSVLIPSWIALVFRVGLVGLAAGCDAQPAAPPGGSPDIGVDATSTPDATADGDAAVEIAPAPVVAGNVVWRRLNRTEYRNTVHDLLGTSLDPGKDLPSDDLGYGFDNVASVLTMSPLHLELYERAARILAEDATSVPLTEEARFITEAEDIDIAVDYGQPYNDAFILWSNGELASSVDLPRDAVWHFELRAWESAAGPERAKIAAWIDGAIIEVFDLASDAGVYTLELPLVKGRHAIAVEFLNDYYLEPADPNTEAADRNAFIDYFGIVGPVPLDVFAETGWARTVKCQPVVFLAGGEPARACAEATVAALATGAWRRPLAATDRDSLLALYDASVAAGAPPTEALALPLQAILMSPRFLFKAEIPPPGAIGDSPLDGYEIATRLSYFLWSTMPDTLLLDAAATGQLATTAGVASQVQRMLKDPKAEALVANFAGQWLYIRDVDNAIPDPWVFPEFDDSPRHAMAEEMRIFFRSFVFEDRSMIELLTATDTWVNRRLAEHYGLEAADVPASDDTWTKVSVGAVGRRGVLTQAGLLTALSNPFRTSIVRRGKWVLGQLLCDEPTPPPPGVVGLVDVTPTGGTPKTLREKMELHKTEERCRTCHQTMDAIGFGLEKFDGIGMARDRDNGFPIDASSEIKGKPFDGAVELAGIIAEDPRLSACMVDKVMIYALGRGLSGDDEPLLDRILADFAARDYRFSALVELVATSEAFLRREVVR